MQIAATPARSWSLTVRMTLSALPYPVSQSAIIGMLTASAMFRSTSSCSLDVIKLASGMHLNEAEIAKPLAQMASNPARSINFALSASWAPTALMIPGRWNNGAMLWRYAWCDMMRKTCDGCQRKVLAPAKSHG